MSVENTTTAITTLNDLLDPSLVASLDRLDLMSKKMLHGRMQGERRSRRRGQGMDFADFRPYAAGDDLRAVASPALRHRLALTFEADADHVDSNEIVRRLVKAMPLEAP